MKNAEADGWKAEATRLRKENDSLREALVSVRSEMDLRKAPKLMAKIEHALGIPTATSAPSTNEPP